MAQAWLQGVRVLDFCWAAAGPYATLLLGFMGAEVLKVEARQRLDLSRRGFYRPTPLDASPEFHDLNVNKRSVGLNLSRPQGIDLVKRLVSHCDVVVENFRPGVIQRLGLGYETLQTLNPRIIMASASANGSTGPESAYPGYAGVFNALSGLGHLTGYADGPPTELRISMDLRVGMTLAFAILAALFARRQTGAGQFIDLSAREAISCLIGHSFLHYTMNGESPQRQGNDEAIGYAPHGCYRCAGKDCWVSIAAPTEVAWRALCQVIGHPEWQAEQRFQDASSRLQQRQTLDTLITSWTQQRTPEEVTQLLQQAGVVAYPTMNSATLAASQHLQTRQAFLVVPHPLLGPQTVLGPPWHSSQGAAQPERSSPLLGEHTTAVLHDLLKISAQDISRLAQEGVIECAEMPSADVSSTNVNRKD